MFNLHRINVLLVGSFLMACGNGDSDTGAAGHAGTDGASASGGRSGASAAAAGHSGASAAAGHSGTSGAAAGHSGASAAAAGNSGAGAAGHSGASGAAAGHSGASGHAGTGGSGGASGTGSVYMGPTVGTAKQFAALAYNSVTTANVSSMVGSIGVSAAAVSVITGFDDPAYKKYGSDSLAPNNALTGTAQGDVTTLVGNIDPRMCTSDLTNVVGGLTGDVTLHPGVTCMNSFSADVLINGHVYLDAGGDSNAFFIIRGNKTLTVADGAQIVLTNGAKNCGVFWRISEAVTIGKTVAFSGTIIAGTAITMKTASTLNGRALAQTAGVQLDANTITAPSDGDCPHLQ
jgi:hypothetical protein